MIEACTLEKKKECPKNQLATVEYLNEFLSHGAFLVIIDPSPVVPGAVVLFPVDRLARIVLAVAVVVGSFLVFVV
jgi:hypothetical protein